MPNIVPHVSDALLAATDANLLPKVPKPIQRAIDAQVGRGLVRAARVQADTYVAHTRVEGASYVARTGMRRVAELSAEEAHYAATTPMAEPRVPCHRRCLRVGGGRGSHQAGVRPVIQLVHNVVGSLFRRGVRQVRPARADADWRALQAVNRINLAHWQAVQAMRAEAARWQDGDSRWPS